jgi:hypothetical protein
LTLSNGQTLTLSNGQTLTLSNTELLILFNGQTLTLSNGQTLTLSNGQTLTLSNGQTLTLSNNQTLTLSNGQTLTLSNSELTSLLNGQTLTLSNGQTLTLSNGQTLTLSNGQTLTLSNGQTLTLSNSEILALFNGQTLTLSNGQTLTLSNGQTLTLSNGQTLTLSNNQTLTLSNGQTLTLSNGQTLTLSNGEPFVVVNGQIQPVGSIQINAAGTQITSTLSNGQTLTLSNGGQLFSFLDGELLSISNSGLLSFSNGQTLTLSNTQLLALSNGQTLTLSNGQTLTLSNGQTLTLSNNGNFGMGNSNTKAMVVVDEADVTTQSGVLAGMFSVNMITGLDAGTQKLIPGTFADLNYDITYAAATVTITERPITITADAKTKVYGATDPALTYAITSGSLVGTDAFTGAVLRTPGEAVGTYAILRNTLRLTNNYNLTYAGANLTITRAPITITADVKFVNQGSPLPAFTSTIVGLINSDQITGIGYSASTVNTAIAGVYENMPSLAAGSYPNYSITFKSDKLYVNPYGTTAKKVMPRLDCVEQVTGNSKYSYIARYSYQNPNPTAVYVPLGPDNTITTAGAYSGKLPVVFVPGTGSFEIYFDGSKMTWTLKTNEGRQKASAAATASATSNKCDARLMTATEQQNIQEAIAAPGISRIYPNPVVSTLTLNSASPIMSEKDVTIVDISGRTIPVKGLRRVSTNVLAIDVSALQKGAYFLRLKTKDSFETFRFIKL